MLLIDILVHCRRVDHDCSNSKHDSTRWRIPAEVLELSCYLHHNTVRMLAEMDKYSICSLHFSPPELPRYTWARTVHLLSTA